LVMLVSSTCITVTSITEKVIAHFRADPTGASLTVSSSAPGSGNPAHRAAAPAWWLVV